MPYKREGKQVLHFKNGKWSIKQTCKNAAAANKAIKLLNAVEHGYHPR